MSDSSEAVGYQTEDFPILPNAYERIHEPHNDGVYMVKMTEGQAQALVDDIRDRYDNVE